MNADSFLEFLKASEDGEFQVVHRTEVVKWSSSPRWKKFSIPARTFCGGDWDRDIKVNVYDWSKTGSHYLIGKTINFDKIPTDFVIAKKLGADYEKCNLISCRRLSRYLETA